MGLDEVVKGREFQYKLHHLMLVHTCMVHIEFHAVVDNIQLSGITLPLEMHSTQHAISLVSRLM